MATTADDTRDLPLRIGGLTGARGDFARGVNTAPGERVVSALVGGALIVIGLGRRTLGGAALAALGGALGYRALSGYCALYSLLDINRADEDDVRGNLGVKVDRGVLVEAPPERVYAAWRHLENLPKFMSTLQRVEVLDDTRSHWTAKAPGGATVEWDAQIINEKPNELIAWRSLPNRLVEHAGSVRFEPTADRRSTLVRVSLQYNPPGGAFTHAVAGLFSADPERQIQDDLLAFKRAIESGTLAA
jgi:uncharacterized membrane protein